MTNVWLFLDLSISDILVSRNSGPDIRPPYPCTSPVVATPAVVVSVACSPAPSVTNHLVELKYSQTEVDDTQL
jgi:hypothetical protein